jgi:hypothetical protein
LPQKVDPAQIALFDPTVKWAYPDWSDGDEEVVFGPHGIAAETRPDQLGPVAIEVWEGELHHPGLRLVGSGNLDVKGNRGVVVGSVTGNDLHTAQIPAGTHRVSVYANRQRGDVDGIYFVFPGL